MKLCFAFILILGCAALFINADSGEDSKESKGSKESTEDDSPVTVDDPLPSGEEEVSPITGVDPPSSEEEEDEEAPPVIVVDPPSSEEVEVPPIIVVDPPVVDVPPDSEAVFDELQVLIKRFARCVWNPIARVYILELSPLVDKMKIAASNGDLQAVGIIIKRCSSVLSKVQFYLTFQPFRTAVSEIQYENSIIELKFTFRTVKANDVTVLLKSIVKILKGALIYCF